MDQWSSHSIKQLPFIDTQNPGTHCTYIVSMKRTLHKIIIAQQHCGSRTKACFLWRVLLLFCTGHVICWPSHTLPLAPLATTCEQMVHSRRRVIESPWRKCNCFSNYVLPATEQWESMWPQLFIENPVVGGGGRGSPLLRFNTNTPDRHSSDDWLTNLTTALIDPARLSPSCKVVKRWGNRNNCSRHRGVTLCPPQKRWCVS